MQLKGAYFFMLPDTSTVKELYVFRPSFCKELMQQGFPGQLMPNIYQPDKRAWCFPLSVDLCKFVIDYYNNTLCRSAPKIVIDYLAEHEEQAQP